MALHAPVARTSGLDPTAWLETELCHPGISLAPDGWRLDDGQTAPVMIDAVRASPRLAGIRAPLVAGLKASGTVSAMGDDGGMRTGADGQVLAEDGTPVPGPALIGRLAEGRVIAAGSIHDCSGGASAAWAARIAG